MGSQLKPWKHYTWHFHHQDLELALLKGQSERRDCTFSCQRKEVLWSKIMWQKGMKILSETGFANMNL